MGLPTTDATLCDVRQRVVSVSHGRWLSREPEGVYRDGPSLYSVLRSNSVRFLDPYGAQAEANGVTAACEASSKVWLVGTSSQRWTIQLIGCTIKTGGDSCDPPADCCVVCRLKVAYCKRREGLVCAEYGHVNAREMPEEYDQWHGPGQAISWTSNGIGICRANESGCDAPYSTAQKDSECSIAVDGHCGGDDTFLVIRMKTDLPVGTAGDASRNLAVQNELISLSVSCPCRATASGASPSM